MSSQQQLYREEQNRGDLPQQADASRLPSDDASASSLQKELGPGTDVMGQPVNPLSESGGASATSHITADPASARSRATPISPTSGLRTPANVQPGASPASGNFPTAQMPEALSTPANQSAAASQQPPGQAASASPYVQTSSVPGASGKTPMDSIMQVFNKWSKKAEDMTGNVWTHLRTGPNVADTAFGRIAMGTKAISEGGLENVYRQTFEVGPEEHLLKTYACYLSTSTGPVAGTLYISTQKLAFCSDRPLAIPSPQLPGNNDATNQPAPNATSTVTNKSSSAQQQQQYCYYKVMVPIPQVESVNPSENTQKKPSEKYVQVKTSDGHEFWFMGFVNYDKGVKNLQEALVSKNTTGPATPTTTTTSYDPVSTTGPGTNAVPPPTNTASYDSATNTAPPTYNAATNTAPPTNTASYDAAANTAPPTYNASYDTAPPTNTASYETGPAANTAPPTNTASYDAAPTTNTVPPTDTASYDTAPPTNTASRV